MSSPRTGPDSPAADPSSRPAWARYLIAQRRRRNLTAREAADRMGVTQQTYAGIEAGTRVRNGERVLVTPKDETLRRVARALELTPTERRHLFSLVARDRHEQRPWQARLRLARVAASVTPTQAARAAGVTVATYREWERKSTAVPRHECLRRLLTHLGWATHQVEEFMAAVPSDVAPARAPQQPTNPVADLPRWSQFITSKRLERGLYLSQVDDLLGQQSVLRRFELGGWPRSDGRLSVPGYSWLDRIAVALTMTAEEHAHLHLLADHQRLAVASAGPRPLLAELLHEVRRAAEVTRREANTAVGLPAGRWSRMEQGDPTALAAVTAETLAQIVDRLPVRPLLAAALYAAIPRAAEPADITGENQHADACAPTG